jgi:MoaA/NifB/PqqE/SkfB family radical SAM enzyme
MMRPDLFEIVEYAVDNGLSVSVSPTTTALTTKDRLQRLRDLGISMIHISIDGATAETHDRFRGFPVTFDRARQTLTYLGELGIPTQVGTTVTRANVGELPQLAELMADAGVRMWNLFFLVPTGRGREEDMVDVETAEATWQWMAELSERMPFAIRTTAAPQFRRTMLRHKRDQAEGKPLRLTGAGYQLRRHPAGCRREASTMARASCSSTTWAASAPPGSCRSPMATCVQTRSRRSTGSRSSSAACETPRR